MSEVSQADRERLEIDFWAASPDERPGADSIDTFTNKMAEARVLLEKFERFAPDLRDARTVLELGGGQCWVSCLVKKAFGAPVVVGSDIAPEAVASIPEWQRVFRVRLEGGLACRSYEIPVRAESLDLVVAFASAHHFGAHRRTMTELARVLRPGGRVLYLHEPGCRRYIHGVAKKRVNRKRPVVAEDVLVTEEIAELGRSAGLSVEMFHAPTTTYRGAVETVYYLGLQKLPFLQRVLPCTVDIALTKR